MIGRRFTDKFPNLEQCLDLRKNNNISRTRSVPSFKRKAREVPVSLGFIQTSIGQYRCLRSFTLGREKIQFLHVCSFEQYTSVRVGKPGDPKRV